MIDLRYQDVEEELRGSLREMLAERCPPQRVLAGCAQPEPYDRALWRTLTAEMGLAGLAVPEPYGGAGAGARELAVVLEELGRALAPVPYLTSAVTATSLLRALDDAPLLTPLAEGTTVAVLAVPYGSGPDAPPGAAVSTEGDRLTGEVAGVADAPAADVLLVLAGGAVYAVGTDDPAVTVTPVLPLDLTRRLGDVRLSGAPARLLVEGPAAAAAWDRAQLHARALLGSEQLGVAQWCLDTTVAYGRARYQFARPVGSFQALKHRLADLWVELAQARAVARYAAGCAAADDPDLPVAAALAQAFCGPVAVRAAEECVQLHGGIGFTWEHPAHLYLKRARSSALALGTAERHRRALADLVDLPA